MSSSSRADAFAPGSTRNTSRPARGRSSSPRRPRSPDVTVALGVNFDDVTTPSVTTSSRMRRARRTAWPRWRRSARGVRDPPRRDDDRARVHGRPALLDGPHKDCAGRAPRAEPGPDVDRRREGDRTRRPGARREAAGLRGARAVPTGSLVDLTVEVARADQCRGGQRRARAAPTAASWPGSCATARSRSSRPTSSVAVLGDLRRRLTRVIDGTLGEGGRLVRQRVGLLEPARRARPARAGTGPCARVSMHPCGRCSSMLRARIRVLGACGVYRTDLLHPRRRAPRPEAAPLVLGHRIVGTPSSRGTDPPFRARGSASRGSDRASANPLAPPAGCFPLLFRRPVIGSACSEAAGVRENRISIPARFLMPPRVPRVDSDNSMICRPTTPRVRVRQAVLSKRCRAKVNERGPRTPKTRDLGRAG